MKQERYLAQLIDADGRLRDFERFSCKRAETVRKNILKMAKSVEAGGFTNLYRKTWKNYGVVKCLVWETQDGSKYYAEPVMEFPIDLED